MHHQLAGREPPRAPEDIALAQAIQRDGERVETIRARRDAAAKEVTAAEQNLMEVKTSVEDAEAIYNNVRAELAAGHGYGDDHDDDEHHVEDDWDKYLHFGDHDHGDDDGGAGSTPATREPRDRGWRRRRSGLSRVGGGEGRRGRWRPGTGATCNPRRRRGDAGRGRGGGARARKPPRAAPRTRRARTRARTRRAALADAGVTERGGEPAPSRVSAVVTRGGGVSALGTQKLELANSRLMTAREHLGEITRQLQEAVRAAEVNLLARERRDAAARGRRRVESRRGRREI